MIPAQQYLTQVEVQETPAQIAEKRGLIRRVTAMLQAFAGDGDLREDVVVHREDEILSRIGQRNPLLGALTQLYAVSSPFDYMRSVGDCRKLQETNPIFAAIIRKLTRTVAEVPTTVRFHEGDHSTQATEVIEGLIKRTGINHKKEEFIRSALAEGGFSWEIVFSTERRGVDRLEYRPHDTIRPNVDKQGGFPDVNVAYQQIDGTGQVVAQFALGQIVDVNLEESWFHDRGIPHLQAARQVLEYAGMMTRGLMQKWMRESGAIEHFNFEDSRHWKDVEDFKAANTTALNAGPENMIRQFFSRGKFSIERLFADAKAHDTGAIEFIMELIFLASGVPKELVGFKSHLTLKDMVEVAVDNYYQHLNKIQARYHAAFSKVVDIELMMNGIWPDRVPYIIEGGRFELVRPTKITKEAIECFAVSMNDIRRSCNLPPVADPRWNVPGLYGSADEARRLAAEAGIDLGEGDTKAAAGLAPATEAEVAERDAAMAADFSPPPTLLGRAKKTKRTRSHAATIAGAKLLTDRFHRSAERLFDSNEGARLPTSVRFLNQLLGHLERAA